MHIQPKSHLPFLGAFDALNAHEYLPPGIKPGVFGISFGSWLAMKLATCERRNQALGACVVFGGYGNFREAVNFAVTGELHGEPYRHHDPRNVPAIYMHIAHTFGLDPKVLQTAWLRYMQETWQIDAMRTPEACHKKRVHWPKSFPRTFVTYSSKVVVHYPEPPRIRQTLQDSSFDYLDTRPAFNHIQCPVL